MGHMFLDAQNGRNITISFRFEEPDGVSALNRRQLVPCLVPILFRSQLIDSKICSPCSLVPRLAETQRSACARIVTMDGNTRTRTGLNPRAQSAEMRAGSGYGNTQGAAVKLRNGGRRCVFSVYSVIDKCVESVYY